MPRKQRDRGAAAVEFALILPILLLLIGGIIDFGNMYFHQIVLSNAARDGARLVAANPVANPGWTQATIQDRIRAASAPFDTPVASGGQVDSTATSWTCGAAGTNVTVTVTKKTAYKFDWTVLGILPGLPTPVPTGKATITCS